ncbi:TetR/AcrR family transcriptional regulator [Salipaludibacillus sp. HK11]|uniref:TetR/AcrR family transcriptional regulator n=1 Tax=Salipaludibacillus sp. HK11 TaxID=3394320 RepID=UPI0039FCCD90
MARPKEFDPTKVLDRAVDIFWEFGYEGTSVHDLIKHLGIGRQSLYDTYGGKRDLFFSALKHYDRQHDIISILENTESGKEAIVHAFDQLIHTVSDEKQSKGCFMVNTAVELAPHDPEVSKFIEEGGQRTELAFYQALIRAQEQGELNTRHQDLKALARFLNSARNGLVVTSKTTPDQVVLQDIVKVILSIFD